MRTPNQRAFCIAGMACLLIACSKDSLEPTLEQDKAVEGGITKTEDVLGLLYGAYDRMSNPAYYGRNVIIYGEIRADNAFSNGNSGRFTKVASMTMEPSDTYAHYTWKGIYEVIASCNIIIGLDPASIEDMSVQQISHFIGQAYALRALGHFDLLKLFGQQHVAGGGDLGIPYVDKHRSEDLAPGRNTVSEVKSKIESDLEMALSLMSPALDDARRTSITTWAVYALQSRVALYFGDWDKVIAAAEAVIDSKVFQIIPREDFISSWYTKSSINSIFELAFSATDNYNVNSIAHIYRGVGYGDIQALADILSVYDEGDVRADSSMIGIEHETGLLRNLGKYPSADWTDNINLIRYEEVILNYAEALFETGRTAEALAQLNLITAARGAQPWPEVTKSNILQERRRELCFEGFRHDDLARNGMDIPLVSPLEQTHGGPSYGSYNYAFPIPEYEINANYNMVQNRGYQ